MSLRDRIATPDGKRRLVRAIFATIADRYDFITVVLSYGQDARWKRRLIDLAAPRPGELEQAPLPSPILAVREDHRDEVVPVGDCREDSAHEAPLAVRRGDPLAH